MRADIQKKDPPPYVPGMDAAGIVDQIGEGVDTGVAVGDRVMAMVVPKASHGAYREQIVLDQRAVVPAPVGTTHVEACTLPMNALTARLSLDLLGLKSGQVIAVTGGPGAYGGYVIQLAKADGIRQRQSPILLSQVEQRSIMLDQKLHDLAIGVAYRHS